MDLDSFEACGFGAYVAWIVGDEVAAGGDSCSILLFFFGTDGADCSGIGYGAAFWDAVLVDEEYGIISFDAAPDTLCEAAKFVGTGE